MGSQTKYGVKELVYVDINIPPTGENNAPGDPLKYGFFTNVPQLDQTALGHIAIPVANYADPPNALVVGCSFPKPRRASKRHAQRFTSSFVGKSKLVSAKKDGYRISPSKGNSKINLNATAFVRSVYVVMRGVKYGWNIPKVTLTNAGDLAGLGVINAVADDRDELCFGANFPKPPRAEFTKVDGDDIKIISTFYDPSKALPDKWTPKGKGKLAL